MFRCLSFGLILLAGAAYCQNDEAYTAKIKEYTTEPFFLTELVDHLPASATVPSPDKVLGYVIGTPNKLTYSADCARYLRALEKASRRIKVLSMGKSEEGREMVVAIISDEENLETDRFAKLKSINAQLGDPRGMNPDTTETLISTGLPFYWATGAMHSPESGSPEMIMELAYRLVVEESPFIKAIRKNSVVMLTPVLETDGRDRYVDTYYWRKNNPTKPAIPLIYWGKYVAHDNNRDGMALSLALSRNVMKTWLDFHPQVLHDLHESVPFLYISTGTGPYNAWLDPITIDEWHILAYNEVDELTRRGVPGVWTHGFYDGWAPNYAFYAANGHNAIGRFYETFGGSGADTGVRNAGNATREWFRPNPPFANVRWSIRNNINLQQSALLLGLYNVATNKEKYLRNYYLKSKRSVAKARTEGPAAYVLPASETRKGQQKALLDMLRRQGVEISELEADVETADGKFAAGSYVVRMDQPYSRMADMLLDKQYYSPDDPEPYDDTGWTLGPLFNVATTRCKDVKLLDAKMHLAKDSVAAALMMPAGASAIVIGNHADLSLAKLRYQLPKAKMWSASAEFKMAGKTWPAGTVIAETDANVLGAMADLGITDAAVGTMPAVAKTEMFAARIALVHTWQNTQDEGWYRLAFESLNIPYKYVSIHEVRDVPDLRTKYDVILLPPGSGSPQSMVNGINPDGDPIPWKPLPGYPNLGGPDRSDNIRGGMELTGVLHLQQFVKSGGLLMCMGDSAEFPVTYGLATGVTISNPTDLRAPGGVFRVDKANDTSPIASGYDESFGVYFSQSPVMFVGGGGFGFGGDSFGRQSGGSRRGGADEQDIVQGRAPYKAERKDGDAVAQTFGGGGQRTAPKAILRFAEEKNLLISGMLQNGNRLAGSAALIDCKLGKGHILLFAINPMWRMQTHGSFALIFNSAMNWKNL